MSLYAEYIKEKEGKEVLEIPHIGFISFKDMGDYFYCDIVYVTRTERRSKIGSELSGMMEAIAKERGAKHIVCEVSTLHNKPTESLLAIASAGYKIKATRNEHIVLEKEL